ncbi:cell wall-binding repeat-containing protein [Herbiconiux ginsengi]|uniref:Putative cell wall binding repeat 2 n=1 Tax=Herbiconiux ginsengi TaxID=381665 RepID=A0A1H3N0J9_9MICO|nr:cell wall-binding repeat-containing protein [Herbiconiux ginsengi]SDY82284.1 Putative cell wall binding repeat 2 [Herbiconiux ginsengi]
MKTHHPIRSRTGAALATGVTAALALSAVSATPALAADPTPAAVSGAVFTWGLSDEAGSKAFGPGYNFLSAGTIAKTSAGDVISQAEWLAQAGNTTIQKKQADGGYATSTWAGLSTDSTGAALTTGGKPSDNRVSIASGTGTADAAADDADISWTGDFTVAFYSGLTQYSVSNPHLVLDNGSGTITATLSGYGTSMENPDEFTSLPATEVTLADLTGVDVTQTGFSVDPEYLGVSITTPEGAAPQVTTGDSWGAFPQSFVDFQGLTGQSSYWYSSGGSSDAGKVALPISVTLSGAPTITVSKTTGLDPATDVVTVTGSGFVPNAPATSGSRPPLAGKFGGVYVAFGTFLDAWKPSEGVPSSARKTFSTKWAIDAADVQSVGGAAAGAVPINPDGSFSVQLTVQKDFTGALAAGNYGIYTYPGSGAVYAPFETYTPLSFELPDAARIEGADRYDVAVKISQTSHPANSDTVYIANGAGFPDALSAAPAAASDDAPLLLTPPDQLLPVVSEEIKRLAPKTIVVVGGPNSVSPAVFSTLQSLAGESAIRIGGADRYEASRNVVDYAFGETGATSAYLATGTNFPDALSASAAGGSSGAPVLLVYGAAAAADVATKATLDDLGVTTLKIAGGPNSVSPGIESSLAAVAPVTRLSGADRFEASIAINRDAFTRADDVFIATGLNFPDALAGAALAASSTAPLYVVPSTCVPQAALDDIAALNPDRVTLLGGPASLSPAVQSLTACAP